MINFYQEDSESCDVLPKQKTESELKKSNNDKIVLGIIILISIFIGDQLKVI